MLSNYKKVSYYLLPQYSIKEKHAAIQTAIKSTIISTDLYNAFMWNAFLGTTNVLSPLILISLPVCFSTSIRICEQMLIPYNPPKINFNSLFNSLFNFFQKHRTLLKYINPFALGVLNVASEKGVVFLSCPWRDYYIKKRVAKFFINLN